jgi:hypothetical protein
MNMNSYAVYDSETGEVLHLHVEPAELNSSAAEIIQQAGVHGSRRLEVVQVPPEGAPADSLHVVEGRLVPADQDAHMAAAGGGVGATDGDDQPAEPAVTRHYEHHAPGDEGRTTFS